MLTVKMALGKRGVSVWVSYVLLTALVVSLGVVVLNWSRSTTQETVDDLVERGDALTTCASAGIDVLNLCQNTQSLNMNVTNSNEVKLEGLWASMFDIYNMPQTSSVNITIQPQKTREVDLLKQGIVKRVEFSPVVSKGGKKIKCLSRKVSFDSVPVCG